MFNKKKLFISLISLAVLVSCNSSKIQSQNLTALVQKSSVQTASVATTSPILVTFNNAYKGLVTENEAIGRADPKSPDKYFISLINSAKTTIDGAFYDIGDLDVTQAFVDAKKRGVTIRLVTDSDNVLDKDNVEKPRDAVTILRNAGIPVIEDNRSGLMHNKFMIVDGQVTWTGSMNLTTSSIFHHNNNSIMVKSPELSANYEAEFKRLFDEKKFGPNTHEIPNKEVIVSGVSFRTYFSPKGGGQEAILEELKKAKKSLRFMVFSMTDKAMNDVVLEKQMKENVKVDGLFDDCMARSSYSSYKVFKTDPSIQLYRDGNQALMHHKVIVIDDETVVTGSFNFSANAEVTNNENILIIKSANIAKQYDAEFARLKYAALNNKDLPPYNHPACNGGQTQVVTPPVEAEKD